MIIKSTTYPIPDFKGRVLINPKTTTESYFSTERLDQDGNVPGYGTKHFQRRNFFFGFREADGEKCVVFWDYLSPDKRVAFDKRFEERTGHKAEPTCSNTKNATMIGYWPVDGFFPADDSGSSVLDQVVDQIIATFNDIGK